jgi:hypothetical protein
VLTVRQCFAGDAEIPRLADAIYRRVDFNWMLAGDPLLLSHGWKPETGFLKGRWDHYCELMILYLLAIGSPTHAIPAESWRAWTRPTMTFAGYSYVSAADPLFVHQYSHAFVDFRGRREAGPSNIDWWQNTVTATRAHRAFCLSLTGEFPGYSDHVWGITASDSRKGYVAWGGPPRHRDIDGSVVPAAAAGSLMLTPDISLPAVREMRSRFGDRIYGRYGFADAFHPTDGWVNPDVIGIDVGITLLSAENLRTGRVWEWFMRNAEIPAALERVGLHPTARNARGGASGARRALAVALRQAQGDPERIRRVAAAPPASPDGGSGPAAKLEPSRYDVPPSESQGAAVRATRVSIVDGQWHLNGKRTYPGAKAEGLLMNVRMVNAVFEDANDTTRPTGFDPDANTDAFIKQIPDYVASGVRAFTIGLQGGMPGYEGAVKSAFNPDGSLRDACLKRVRRVIDASDWNGAVVILGCYYQRQDQILRDEGAVRAGVVNVARWVQDSGFTNVVLEIANEFAHRGFDHAILKNPQGEAELIALAKKTAPDVLVSTAGMGSGTLPDEVAKASDFLLIHFNTTELADVPERIAALKKYRKPIVCNEDDKVGVDGARAAERSVAGGASWGFMHSQVNQYFPLQFNGTKDDPAVYSTLRRLTTATERAFTDDTYFPGAIPVKATPTHRRQRVDLHAGPAVHGRADA